MAMSIEEMQEAIRRGVQHKIPEADKANFDEALRRGMITSRDESAMNAMYPGAALVEPLMSMGTGIASEFAAGASGIASSIFNQDMAAGAETVESVRENLGAYEPRTSGGKAGLKTLGNIVEGATDVINFPMSGLAGLGEILQGHGLDQAVDTISSVQDDGLGPTLGTRTLETTGSPELATLAHIAPEGIAEILGMKGAGRLIDAGPTQTAADLGNIVSDVTPQVVKDIADYQTPGNRRRAMLLEQGSTDVDTARVRLIEQDKPEGPTPLQTNVPTEPRNASDPLLLPAPEGTIPAMPDRARLADVPEQDWIDLDVGGRRVETDVPAVRAINQGYRPGVVATIKGESPANKAAMNQMVDIMEGGKRNELYRLDNRPSDVVGDTLMARYETVQNFNREAADKLDVEARALSGQEVNISSAFDTLYQRMQDMGISRGEDGLDFQRSSIRNLPGPQDMINNVLEHVGEFDPLTADAHQVHMLKQALDEQIEYGKTITGARGKTQNIVRQLRIDLDAILDQNFDAYNRVNTQYSDTKTALDNFDDAAGAFDLRDANAEKAIGTRMRALMSNQQSRVPLGNSMQALEDTARKYGAQFDGDVKVQAMFANELDRVFGPAADTSLAGELAAQGDRTAATVKSWKEMGIPGALWEGTKVAGKGVGRAMDRDFNRVTEENKFKTIRDLLNE